MGFSLCLSVSLSLCLSVSLSLSLFVCGCVCVRGGCVCVCRSVSLSFSVSLSHSLCLRLRLSIPSLSSLRQFSSLTASFLDRPWVARLRTLCVCWAMTDDTRLKRFTVVFLVLLLTCMLRLFFAFWVYYPLHKPPLSRTRCAYRWGGVTRAVVGSPTGWLGECVPLLARVCRAL